MNVATGVVLALMAVAFIFGMSRSTGADIEIPKTVLFAVIFCVSCVILRVIMKHRAEKRSRQKQAQSQS